MAEQRAPVPATRPLLDTRPDMSFYLGRVFERSIVDGLRRGLNVVLEGPRGSGKTTTLHRLRWLARAESTRFALASHPDANPSPNPSPNPDLVLVRARPADSPAAFLHLALAALAERDTADTAAAPGAESDGPGGAVPSLPGWRELASAQGALRLLRAALARRERRVVFLVDDIDPVVGNQVFGVLRDDLWDIPAQWVVTTLDTHAPTLLGPPADAFFDLTVRLPPLTSEEAGELLRLRTGEAATVPERPWQPRELLQLASTTEPSRWEEHTFRRVRQRREISRLGRPASMLADILDKLGPVSPSDERVLAETGWTRSRVSQVLRQLLDAGQVTYAETPNGRAGRPVRLYRLIDPEGRA